MIRSLSRPVTNSSPLAEKSQIARPQVVLFRRLPPARLTAKCLLGRLLLLPIAQTHAGTADPDLAHLMLGQRNARFRLDNQHFFVGEVATAPDQEPFVLVAGRHGDDAVFVQRLAVETADGGRFCM